MEKLYVILSRVEIGTGTRVWRRFVGFHEKVWKTAENRFLINRSLTERSWRQQVILYIGVKQFFTLKI
jgi:hypothetical protein